jgi:hypothetical protein
MGDNLTLEDEGWLQDMHTVFLMMSDSEEQHAPIGFGIVTFTDITSPLMLTFLIIVLHILYGCLFAQMFNSPIWTQEQVWRIRRCQIHETAHN